MTEPETCRAAEVVADTLLSQYSEQLTKPKLWMAIHRDLSIASLRIAFHRRRIDFKGLIDALDERYLFSALRDETLPPKLRDGARNALQNVPLMGKDLTYDRQGIVAAHLDRFRNNLRERVRMVERAGAFDALLTGDVDWRHVAAKAA